MGIDSLSQRVLDGERRALARTISLVENGGQGAGEALAALYPHTGHAHRVGVTGGAGTGKSTLVNALAKAIRGRDQTVGILAVDPTSPFSGGAILGDRIRMQDLAGDPGIFIRSMATRGGLGGLARATTSAVEVLDAAGFDVVLIETVGAGQSEVDIAKTAHTTVVVEAPGLGDDIQAIKAGLLEIADVLVVNKADHPHADNAFGALRGMLHMNASRPAYVGHHGPLAGAAEDGQEARDQAEDGWQVPILKTVATEEEGVEALLDAIQDHRVYLAGHGELAARERARVMGDLEARLQEALLAQLIERVGQKELARVVEAVTARRMDPHAAAAELMRLAG